MTNRAKFMPGSCKHTNTATTATRNSPGKHMVSESYHTSPMSVFYATSTQLLLLFVAMLLYYVAMFTRCCACIHVGFMLSFFLIRRHGKCDRPAWNQHLLAIQWLRIQRNGENPSSQFSSFVFLTIFKSEKNANDDVHNVFTCHSRKTGQHSTRFVVAAMDVNFLNQTHRGVSCQEFCNKRCDRWRSAD